MSSLVNTIKEVGAAFPKVDAGRKEQLVKSLVRLTDKLIEGIEEVHVIPQRFLNEFHPVIEKQVVAAEKRTQKAADSLMESAEKLQSALSKVEGEGKKEIQQQVNAIFELCTFQDLVAQHLNEVTLRMNALKDDMEKMSSSIFHIHDAQPKTAQPKRKTKSAIDNPFLNGPTTEL